MTDQRPTLTAVGAGTATRPSPPRDRGGRPTVATPEILELVDNAIRAGMKPPQAAAHAGLGSGTHHKLMARGQLEAERLDSNPRAKARPRENPFLQYFLTVKRAEADAIAHALVHITNQMPTNWTAAAWWLERTYPTEYSRPEVRVALHGGKPGETHLEVEVDVRDELTQSFAQMHQRLRSSATVIPTTSEDTTP